MPHALSDNAEHEAVIPKQTAEGLTYGESSLPVRKLQSNIVLVLRWIAVLPAAVLAFFAIQLVIILADATMAEGHAQWFLQLVNSFASAYCFVYAGAHTAPRFRFAVGIVLAVIFVILVGTVAYLGYFIRTSEPFWWLAVTGVASGIAAIAGVIQLREERLKGEI